MTTDLRVLAILGDVTDAIGKLNELDDRRAAEIAALRDDVRALSNRIEALTRSVSHAQATADQASIHTRIIG